jgi:hypothetical protein
LVQTALAETVAANPTSTSFTETPTPSPETTPTASQTPLPTKDPRVPYVVAYVELMKKWYDALVRIQTNNQRIAEEGVSIYDDEEFRDELTSSLSDFEQVAKDLEMLKPPVPELQWFADHAEELRTHSDLFVEFYRLGLLGDDSSMELAISFLEDASDTYLTIVDKLDVLLDELLDE